MKKLAKKVCSLALALALALCCLPAAYAAENEITVSFSYYDGAVVIPKSNLAVYDGIAEEYGYTLRGIEDISVFDAIVAAHKSYYGDEFTAETANNYLEMSAGFITKAFKTPSASLGFFVNDAMPNDGVFNESYNSYTGYACDQAAIADGDYISLFAYKNSMWLDYYMVISDSETEVITGEEFTVSATGYSAMWYGCYREEDRAAYTYPMAGIEVFSTADFETYSKVGTLDENGSTTLSFDKAGTVHLLLQGNFEDPAMGKIPVVGSWCKITVSEPEPEPEPTYEDAFYLPKSFDVSVDTESKEDSVILSFTIGFFDFNGEAPEKCERFTFEITCPVLITLIEFLSDIRG